MHWPFSVPRGPLDVLGVGVTSVDHLCVTDAFPAPDSDQRLRAYEVQPGGSVATALTALTRWGARTMYAGAFGDDDGARRARAALEESGVDCTAAMVRPNAAQPMSIVLVDARGGTRTRLSHRGAALALDPAEVPLAQVAEARAVLVDGVDAPAAIAAMHAARAARVPTIADVDGPFEDLERFLALVDVLIVPRDFAMAFTRCESPDAALAALARRGHAVTAITLGAAGAIACVGEQCLRVPGLAVAAVDPTGAGAVFRAALVWGMLDGFDVAATLRLANAAAALQCTRLGALRPIPSLAQARALAASTA